MKTLIELFDNCQTENIAAALEFAPEKIVCVGFKETMTQKRMRDFERLFEMRGLSPEISYEIVGRYDFDAIVATLERITDTNESCFFDLTGGKEIVLAAMGFVAGARRIPMVQIDIKSGKPLLVKYCENMQDASPAVLTIEECVSLNGGAVVYADENEVFWNLTPDFRLDIEAMWSLCKPNCALWNKHCYIFSNFERYGDLDANLWLHVDFAKLRAYGQDCYLNPELMRSLVDAGLITEYKTEGDMLSFRYKNEQVYKCLTKSGSILELYTYLSALDIQAQDPEYYADVDVGVHVDWDGVLHSEFDKARDTRNEIDVIFMRGMIPIFVSCKNGEVHKEALYELSSLAERYGGAYVKKILLTTYMNNDEASRKYLLQRAKDMGIVVMENVHLMEREEFTALLKQKTK